MLTHTYRKNTDSITFIAGDLDFRPLLEAVVREGMYVRLLCEPRSASTELQIAADDWVDLDFFQMHQLCTSEFRAGHPPPGLGYSAERVQPQRDAVLRWEGYTEGTLSAQLFDQQFANELLVASSAPVNAHGQFAQMVHTDSDLLKGVYDDKFGPLEWRATVVAA
jgi:hypothetical protein